MKRILSMLVVSLLVGLAFSSTLIASSGDIGIDERYGKPKVVLGEALSEEQKDQVRNLLNVTDPEQVDEYIVTAEDLVNFIDGDPSSNMYSSAKITRQGEGYGVVVNIVNPENITQVTSEMYANALLTAGIENALVEVASPLKVSGHSALTGIYKAYNVDGESLDKERMEVANQELDVATDLTEDAGIDESKVSELLTEIKKQIAEQNPATKEDVERIVSEQLENLNIQLSPEDREMLTNLFEKMRNINIDFGQVTEQLDSIVADLKGKLDEVTGGDTEGFWQSVKDFFTNLIDSIRGLFS
ncbi:Uncharacterized protein YpuA, DUF1002 family [Gracilibacillus ureilyticus]|uniref:Uncharacterized protein YpuA, DUF1002 family n=1 Tax=Gracilibacillus ureilyticus TaxID=531814 RepID=A0A1H9MZP3_9BACI|nr:DUF1002 domain-containing protein [Gracilibacillus ureilyticus]SER29200.1 Uncharacterized protein YpuA, DUF1002 family [Gracilibacillus ureilyticus]